jgi:hypothetical protein
MSASETLIKLEPIVSPCDTCANSVLCKFKYNCNKQIKNINTNMAIFNKFLTDVSEEDNTSDELLNVAFESNAVPVLKVTCRYFRQEKTSTDSTDPETPVEP